MHCYRRSINVEGLEDTSHTTCDCAAVVKASRSDLKFPYMPWAPTLGRGYCRGALNRYVSSGLSACRLGE